MGVIIDIGRLKDRIYIMAPTASVDALGQPVEAWTLQQAAWADVRYQTGLQTLTADRLTANTRVSMRIRQHAASRGITTAMRAVLGGALAGGVVTGGTVFKIMDTPRQGLDAIDLVCEAL